GRITRASIERGTRVTAGSPLIEISAAETDAQAKEAEANAAQIEARLGMTGSSAFNVNAVPEVQTATAGLNLATEEFGRIKSLLDQHVVSQSEFDQRRTQLESARQQVESAKNAAAEQYQAPLASRPRESLSKQAL